MKVDIHQAQVKFLYQSFLFQFCHERAMLQDIGKYVITLQMMSMIAQLVQTFGSESWIQIPVPAF